MSKLMIRGGYGEHGRSCFLVEYGDRDSLYMVDCGIMDTDPFPYPDVTPEELARVEYLFLTHCHKDHSGAFEYFCQRGFRGTLVTSRMTCLLAGIEYEKTEYLDIAEMQAAVQRENCRQFGSLMVCYGRTGHCPGGLWFEIAENMDPVNTIVFSGDYQEDTMVYRCDPICGRHAKLALIDCAHRETELNAEELRRQIISVVSEKRKNGRRVILPVPQYGRGLELLLLMQREFPKMRIRVDRDFLNYARKMLSEPVWYHAEAYRELKVENMDVMDIFGSLNVAPEYEILLLADTHLKKQKHVDFVHNEIEAGAAVLINGRVKKNGPAGKLLDAGKAEKFLFPHHQSHHDLKHVVAENSFGVVLPFHNNEKEIVMNQ